MWHIEQLDAPQIVKSVTESHLVLADGREVALPFIKAVPRNNPVFQTAISSGIEISPAGEVFGLMWYDRMCGNDPVVWRRIRINLSDLAGVLYPGGIDDSIVHPDDIAFIQEHKQVILSSSGRSHRTYHLNGNVAVNMRSVRRLFESSLKDGGGS